MLILRNNVITFDEVFRVRSLSLETKKNVFIFSHRLDQLDHVLDQLDHILGQLDHILDQPDDVLGDLDHVLGLTFNSLGLVLLLCQILSQFEVLFSQVADIDFLPKEHDDLLLWLFSALDSDAVVSLCC